MNFKTEVKIPQSTFRINHKQHNLLLGSCFVENIGTQLLDNKFDVQINPFGIVYNPFSSSSVLKMLLDGHQFSENEILFDKGLYFSLMHHSDFSDVDQKAYLSKIQSLADTSAQRIRNLDVLFVTFGTSYVYVYKQTGEVVSNCHKLPASAFDRRRLSVGEIVDEWSALISRILSFRENAKIVFTVSPIRHWKDGAHENQLSKSILLLAIEEIQRLFPSNVVYFPAYELVLDDLRDYRFYAEDMIHPNKVALSYIWQKFSDTFFEKDTLDLISRWNPLAKAIAHRPFREETDEHQLFLKKTLMNLQRFIEDYPYIDCTKEIQTIRNSILE